MVIRTVIGTLITILLSGILAYACMVFLSPAHMVDAIHYQPAVVGGLTSLSLHWVRLRRTPYLKGAVLLVRRSNEAEIRDEAFERLELLVARSTQKASRRNREHATLTLFTLPLLSERGCWDTLEAALSVIHVESLTPSEQAVTRQARATVYLHQGQVDEAREMLAPIERPTKDETLEIWLVAMDALILAVSQKPEAALDLIGDRDPSEDPALAASHGIIRAHAWADTGQEEKARAALQGVLGTAGPAALERAILPVGPASRIARDLLAGTET